MKKAKNKQLTLRKSYSKKYDKQKRRAEKMEESELEGKIIVGEFANKPHDELTANIRKLVEENSEKPLAIKSAFEELD